MDKKITVHCSFREKNVFLSEIRTSKNEVNFTKYLIL